MPLTALPVVNSSRACNGVPSRVTLPSTLNDSNASTDFVSRPTVSVVVANWFGKAGSCTATTYKPGLIPSNTARCVRPSIDVASATLLHFERSKAYADCVGCNPSQERRLAASGTVSGFEGLSSCIPQPETMTGGAVPLHSTVSSPAGWVTRPCVVGMTPRCSMSTSNVAAVQKGPWSVILCLPNGTSRKNTSDPSSPNPLRGVGKGWYCLSAASSATEGAGTSIH